MLQPGNINAGTEARAVNGEGVVSTLDYYHTSQRFSGTIIRSPVYAEGTGDHRGSQSPRSVDDETHHQHG